MRMYRAYILAAISHNDRFSHTKARVVTAYANSEEEVRDYIVLNPAEVTDFQGFRITQDKEWIQRIEDLGNVEHFIKVTFQMPNGLLNVTNTVEDPEMALAQIARIIREEKRYPLLTFDVESRTTYYEAR